MAFTPGRTIIMPRISTLPIRRAILTLAKSDAALTALVPASRIYPQSPPAQPAWPFIRYGAPTITPIFGQCAKGGEVLTAMHVFAKQGPQSESAEDYAQRIAAALEAALDKQSIDLAPGRARLVWDGTQVLQDGDEAGAYHAIVSLRVRAFA